jgi:nitrate/nitrite transporter NarK
LHDWQCLFLLEGLPCLAVAAWVLTRLPDRPHGVSWLTGEERLQLEASLANEAAQRARSGAPERAAAVFKMPVVWLLCLLYFCTVMGLYGLSFWLPQIIKDLGWSKPLHIGLISAIPWLTAVVFMLLWGASSDRFHERRLHAAVAAMVAAAGFVLCGLTSPGWFGLVAISIAAAGVMGMMAVQWAIPSALLNGPAAAAGIAMVNSFGNLGGFVSPTLVGQITVRTGSHAAGLYVTGGFLVLAGLLFFAFRFLQPAAAHDRR